MPNYMGIKFLAHADSQNKDFPVAVYPKVYTFVDKCNLSVEEGDLAVIETRNGRALGLVAEVYIPAEEVRMKFPDLDVIQPVLAVIHDETATVEFNEDKIDTEEVIAIVARVLPWLAEDMEA